MHDNYAWWIVTFGKDLTSSHHGMAILLSRDLFQEVSDLAHGNHFRMCSARISCADSVTYMMCIFNVHFPCYSSSLAVFQTVWHGIMEKWFSVSSTGNVFGVLGGDFNVEFSQDSEDVIAKCAKSELFLSCLAEMGFTIHPHNEAVQPTRFPWPGQLHEPRALDWISSTHARCSDVMVLPDLLNTLTTDHVCICICFQLNLSGNVRTGLASRRYRRCLKGWSLPNQQEVLDWYRCQLQLLWSFFQPIFQTFDVFAPWSLTMSSAFHSLDYESVTSAYTRALAELFMLVAVPPIRKAYSDGPELMQLIAERRVSCNPQKAALSKRIVQMRSEQRIAWRKQLLLSAAAMDWKSWKEYRFLGPLGRRKVQFLPQSLSTLDGSIVLFSGWTQSALNFLSHIFQSDDMFVDAVPEVQARLDYLGQLISPVTTRPFQIVEMMVAVRKLTSCKAVGFDGLSAEILMPFSQDDFLGLLVWFNGILTGQFTWPAAWRGAWLHLVPKIQVPTTFSDFRPLAVTSTLYKLFMRLVTYRLQSELGKHRFGQMAGIQGAQVHDFLTALDLLARKSREWRFPAYLLSWDLAKAFDSLEWSAVLDLCQLRGVSPEIESALLQSLCAQESFIILYGQVGTSPLSPTRGIRQGAPESAVVFSYCVDMVLERIRDTMLYRQLFDAPSYIRDIGLPSGIAWVDDIYFLACSGHYLQELVATAVSNFDLVGLRCNFKKVSLLCNQHAARVSLDISGVSCRCQSCEEAIRILGVQFSWQMGTLAHVNVAFSRAWGVFCGDSAVFTCKETPLKVRVMLLNAKVSPLLLWACQNWLPTKTLVARLNTLQLRMMSRMVLKTRPATTSWLEHHRCKFRLVKSLVRAADLECLKGSNDYSFCSWGLKFLLKRFNWMGHVLRNSHTLANAVVSWRNFHWWHVQQQLEASATLHPGRLHPWRADSDLELLWKVPEANGFDSVFDFAANKLAWQQCSMKYAKLFWDSRLHKPSTAALDDDEASATRSRPQFAQLLMISNPSG